MTPEEKRLKNRAAQAKSRQTRLTRLGQIKLLNDIGRRAFDRMSEVDRNNKLQELGKIEFNRITNEERKQRLNSAKARKAAEFKAVELKVDNLTESMNKLVIKNNKKIKKIVNLPPTNNLEISELKVDLTKHQLKTLAHKNCEDLIAKILDHQKDFSDKKKKLPKTISGNIKKIQNIFEAMFEPKLFDCKDFSPFLDHKSVVNFIISDFRKNNPPNTAKKDFTALAAILRHLGEDFREAQSVYSKTGTNINDEYEKRRKENKYTPAETDKLGGLNWASFQKAGRAIKNVRDRAIYSLMSEMAPRRAGVFRKLLIKPMDYKNDEYRSSNVILVDAKNNPQKIILSDYKTVDTYGQFTINLNDYKKIKPILKKYIKANKLKYDDIMFQKQAGKLYADGAFKSALNKIIQKYTKTKMTSKLARNLYATHYIKPTKSIAERERVALALGHNPEESEKYAKIK